ncbi:SRPBCC domain-containing protein [Brachybacterium tyrofermentans]|uniref:SRPBCC domain-containing protein n=1 Tax=Brachybacterium tyrofermentans TaxID=47848 RepID=A0ABW0FC04_9MICO|nr:SRPBCC domain-containing protein [Brachybacterium tyrofermentans]SLM97276.1 Aha1 domain protein [Corynebacterium xerosis]
MAVTESLPVVDAVRRELEIDEQIHDGRTLVRTTATLTTNIDRSPAQLWPLLTRPDQLAPWFGQICGDLREGGRFEAPRGARGRLLQVEAPHKISLTWEDGGSEDPLSIRLDPEDDGTTLLRLRHTRLIPQEEFDLVGPGLGAVTWEISLLALAAMTDGWRTSCLHDVPRPSSAWLASEEGAAYIRAWSVRWAAEAIAAGLDEGAARRAEIETNAAYGT